MKSAVKVLRAIFSMFLEVFLFWYRVSAIYIYIYILYVYSIDRPAYASVSCAMSEIYRTVDEEGPGR